MKTLDKFFLLITFSENIFYRCEMMITCIAVSVLQSALELKLYSIISFDLRYRNFYTVYGHILKW